jgi:hypothetical protein
MLPLNVFSLICQPWFVFDFGVFLISRDDEYRKVPHIAWMLLLFGEIYIYIIKDKYFKSILKIFH